MDILSNFSDLLLNLEKWELKRVLATLCMFVCSLSVNWTEHWWHSKCFAALHSWWSWWCFEKDTGKTFANSHDQGQIFKFWRHQNDFLTSCFSWRIFVFAHLTEVLTLRITWNTLCFYAKQYSQLLKNIHSKVKSLQFSGITFFFFAYQKVCLSPKSGQTSMWQLYFVLK